MTRAPWLFVPGAMFGAIAVAGCSGPAETADSGADVGAGADSKAEVGVRRVPMAHLSKASPCLQPRPAGLPGPWCGDHSIGISFLDGGCNADPDCDGGQNGRCNCAIAIPSPNVSNECTYDQCTSDTDCNGTVCHCREDPPTIQWGTQTFCFPSGNCLQDSDCGPGGYCSPSLVVGCGYDSWNGFFCHTPGDECTEDQDCPQGNAYCAHDSTSGRWICATGTCPDG